ncbi:HAD-like domain-containing protein [Armillaria novae-zelandiae]|uniref:4-nitrophenylphosphatase n=1 Tax=Armillaria novae-zelandiae TaxID=153914 RepID=A0AA39P354_9AGAR|nr:HAD-like domain-containing protein [Armillaria novae-zelandiae]
MVRLCSSEQYASLIDNYDTWMFDCDGVLWHDDQLIDGALNVLRLLRHRKKTIVFVTNNATKSRRDYKTKFDKLGVEAYVDEIYGSAYASAVYLSSVVKFPKDKKVYVIGMSGLEEELKEEGIQCLGGTDPADRTLEPFSLADFVLDEDVAAVLCGFDSNITYTKLSKAFQYLTRNPGCQFLVTNEDSTYPNAYGILPGGGALSASLRYALGKNPLCIGKPSTTMLDCIRAKISYDPKRTIMVGDRLNTDILFGQNGGISTLLVLTGITVESDVTGPNASNIIPDYVTGSVGDIRAAGRS